MRWGQLGARLAWAGVAVAMLLTARGLYATETVYGHYMEARTCQVYTGPCFANGESGIAGRNAVMAWSIEQGDFRGVDLTGLKVAVVVSASQTLGFRGLEDPETLRSMILVDQSADDVQRAALIDFAREQSGRAGQNVVKIESAPFAMKLDEIELTGELSVEGFVHLTTRQARQGDCICSNESAYYPPLANLQGFVPGVTIEGEVRAYSLGSRWSIPDSRTAYMGTFTLN